LLHPVAWITREGICWNGIQQLPGVLNTQDRGLAALDDVGRTLDRRRGVGWHELADHHIVKEHLDGGQVLLKGRYVTIPDREGEPKHVTLGIILRDYLGRYSTMAQAPTLESL
jgi:hypothetical protein